MGDSGFKVVDKRRFVKGETTEGKEEVPEEREAKPSEPLKTQEQTQGPLPPIDFSTFILSLSASALMHLGELPDPVTQKKEKNLPLAKHTIDTIDMLKTKTQGNLSEDEKRLLDHILYDLKMRYVTRSSQ
ncbi:MAG: DUF1844 domain-containing protein [Deltaproteobacteria bacterium]|nr:DUF1844 domain-containing protein [Deltaproteobacteria bacterium]